MDGANALRRFFNVTLPMISPALFFCFIILTLAGLNQFTQAYTAFFGAGGAGGTYGVDAALFYAIYIFRNAFVYFDMGYACAMAWMLVAISLFVTGINVLVSRRFVFYQGEQR
jgi:multiple sugar transport system permease protein